MQRKEEKLKWRKQVIHSFYFFSPLYFFSFPFLMQTCVAASLNLEGYRQKTDMTDKKQNKAHGQKMSLCLALIFSFFDLVIKPKLRETLLLVEQTNKFLLYPKFAMHYGGIHD